MTGVQTCALPICDITARGNEADASGVAAINSAVTAYAKDNGLNITTADGWNQAWLGAKKASPELFQH